jgi:hypothetical protein
MQRTVSGRVHRGVSVVLRYGLHSLGEVLGRQIANGWALYQVFTGIFFRQITGPGQFVAGMLERFDHENDPEGECQ